MKDVLLEKQEFATKELEAIEPKEEEEESFYCRFCGVDKVEDCKCDDSRNQYNGEE